MSGGPIGAGRLLLSMPWDLGERERWMRGAFVEIGCEHIHHGSAS